MLQPKSYTQIARPNLYNVAYRRVGAYKGMGRLHPTNYLQIGVRPNQIGATTGQYNTLSGQLSLLPPSLRGLGQTIQLQDPSQYPIWASPADIQAAKCAADPLCGLSADWYSQLTGPAAGPAGGPQTTMQMLQAFQTQGAMNPSSLPTGQEAAAALRLQQLQKWLPWALGGGVVLLLLLGRR